MTKREEIQQKASLSITDNKFRGIVDVAFRVGKTKLTIDALNTIKSEIKVLILAPNISILDGWKAEIKKWKLKDSITVEFLWSNSLKKKIEEIYHLIIADECHAYNKKVLLQLRTHQIKGTRILGLTGTLDQVAEWNLKNILSLEPIFRYSFDEAVRDGIIADYSITCVGLELDDVEEYYELYEGKSLVTEKAAYRHWDNLYKNAVKLQQFKKLQFLMSRRTDIIYNSKTKLLLTQQLVDNEKRCLIFTGRTEIADKIGDGQFHSKSSKKSLELFQKSKLNKLAVVSQISMGITIPKLKVAIFNQMKSVEALALQQTARVLNLEDGKQAKIWIIYLKETQDEIWISDAVKGFNKEKITWL